MHVTYLCGLEVRTIQLKARQGWTLYQLTKAGRRGITSLERPALRLAAYVHNLRKRGFTIETEMEQHGGAYKGRHARYRLLTQILAVQILSEGGTK
ncbi:hypothetical protein GO499_06550 [Algicella marina]|uniref:Winged helix domain-containing protein n=1 Tax=Algicella marina TaxID=2683284 RepID=A0A6P1T3J8_9RHOB|nr:hypothetical protein GO499_06550 [Algicella marina]